MARSVQKLIALTAAPLSGPARNAHIILEYALEAATALLKAFDASRTARRASGGNTTDEEQDLLRAMLVFAGAGLDAAMKRLVEDSLLFLAPRDEEVRKPLEGFAARRLREEAAKAPDTAKGYALLAAAITSNAPQTAVVKAYVDELIGGSLQSVDRLSEALGALGLRNVVTFNVTQMKAVFADRNRIVHEMDIDLSRAKRRRVSRKRDPMIAAVNTLLDLAFRAVTELDRRIP